MTTITNDPDYVSLQGDILDASASIGTPSAPWDLVTSRFDNTLAKAEEMYVLLVGEDGAGGYLGAMNDAIQAAPTIDIVSPTVDTSYVLESSGLSVPTFDRGDLQEYPTDSYSAPTLDALPSVDSLVDDVAMPDDVAVSMSWAEAALPTTVYDAILARMLVDLQSGATGLDPTVEQAIYDRARLRQQNDRLAEYNKINDTASALQFQYPSGVLLSALTDFGIGATRQDADIENQIIVTQGDLAQKNSQFMMQQAVALEQLIRQTRGEESGRSLDAAKHLASMIAEDFKSRVQKYLAAWEGKKTRVMAQVEVLKGVIDSNRGLIDIFKAQWESVKTQVDAVSAANKSLTDVYLGEVNGFSEAEKAIASRNDAAVKLIMANVSAAELEVRAAIADAESTVQGYTSENSLRAQVSGDMAKIATQTVASALSAVNASASIGYSGNESSNRSFGLSANLSESHSFEHDPLT